MDSVVIVNPDYTIHHRQPEIRLRNEISYFIGPTEILNEGQLHLL